MSRRLLVIARAEIRSLVRDGRFRVYAVAVAVLLVTALWLGRIAVVDAQTAAAEATAIEAAVWLDLGTKNPHSAAHFGRWAFKPKPALAILDPGLDPFLGTAVFLEAHWQDPFSLRPAEDRSALQRMGELDAALLLQILMPLAILLATFGAFAVERERGTLRLLLATGIEPRVLALGKALGIATAFGGLLVPAAAIGATVTLWNAPDSASADLAARAALLAGAYGLYFALFLSLGLAVSAWFTSSRTALVASLGFWLCGAMVVPRLAADLAEHVHPSPTPAAFRAAIAADEANGIDGHPPASERGTKLENDVLAKYGVSKVEDLPVSFAGIALQASEEFSNLVFDRHYGRLWQTWEDQAKIQRLVAALSPWLAMRQVSAAMAGTDHTHHRHFADAAERHRRELVLYLNQDMTTNAVGTDFTYQAGPELWRRAPTFSYEQPRLAWALARSAPAFVALVLWCGVALGLAVLALARLRPV